MHKSRQRQLRPPLPHVCGAAAIIGLQTKKVGFLAVGTEEGLSREALTCNLVALLVILVGPHIFADSGRKGIKGKDLQPLCPFSVSGIGIEPLAGIHLLHDGTELCTLDGTEAGEAFIAGVAAVDGAVILIENAVELFRKIRIGFPQQIASTP